MKQVYFIEGLDCANCAAKLERHLKEIPYFDDVVIDFMAKKLIITAKDETGLQTGFIVMQTIISQVEPGVIVTEKTAAEKKRRQSQHNHHHGETCGCGHEHHEYHGENCDCGQEHGHEQHGGSCSCGHNHSYEHHHEHHEGSCSCGCDSGTVPYPITRLEQEILHAEPVLKEPAQKVQNHFTDDMKRELVKIGISAVLFLTALFIPHHGAVQFDMLQFALFLLAYLTAGGEVLLRAGKNIVRGQIFDENFLMTIATIGAFCVGEYPEGVMVMLLYQLGELFQNYAVQKSRNSIAELMDIKPEVAHVKEGDRYISMAPEEVVAGDIIQIRPGEKVPLDGIVVEGHSMLDTVALTGESIPQEAEPGNRVMSGCINTSGVLTVRVEKEYEDSTVAKILDLVENASSKKAEAENFITRFARYYTPAVVIIAAVLAIIPPIVLQQPFSGWIYRALVFLVISCPCALVISIPLTFFSGLGVCSRHGILVKGSNYLEALAQIETAVFDKTGTLTKGRFAVTSVYPVDISEEELLYYAACAESISNHPIADAIQKANMRPFSADALQHAEEAAGYGISANVNGKRVLAGNQRLMMKEKIAYIPPGEEGTVVYIAIDGRFCGTIVIADELKENAADMVKRLKQLGVKDCVMLTGDNHNTAQRVAEQIGITSIFSQLLPGDKVACLEQLLQQKSRNGKVVFTGDGLNDAPVLARADVGIAMGGLGSDAAIEAADVVIMNDQPEKLVDAVQIARKTRSIVKQNIVFVLIVKLAVLLLGALGMATMWMAVFADVGVAFLAILNAVRIMKY